MKKRKQAQFNIFVKRHTNRHIKRHRLLAIAMSLLLLILSAASCFAVSTVSTGLNNSELVVSAKDGSSKNTSKNSSKNNKQEIARPGVSAGAFMVMSGSTSEVVYEEHASRKLTIGALTKYMTAMVVIDNMYDDSEYSNQIEVSAEVDAYGDLFKLGDTVSVKDMLYAMLVANSDEAAEALARYSASDRDTFINEMNSKVMEIGLMNTQYHNPTGRYHVDHYSTASDCAIIVQYAMRYPMIARISKTDAHAMEVSGRNGSHSLTVTNTNPLLSSTDSTERYGKITGGIQGVLNDPNKAAQYAGVAVDRGMQLIVVMLEENPKKLAADAKNLFEYGFYKVSRHRLFGANEKVGHVRVKGGSSTRAAVYTETQGFAYVPPEGNSKLVQTKVNLYDDVQAPLKAGDKVGEYEIYIADELKGTVNLVVKKDIPKGWLPSNIYISNLATALIVLLLILLLLLFLRIMYVRRRRAKLREYKRRMKIREEARRQLELEEDRRRRNWTYK